MKACVHFFWKSKTMQTIVNGAPMTIFRGTQDLSTVAQVVEPEARPTHLPKIYLYAKSGPTTPQLVVGASRVAIYGDESFDLRKPWATHATVLANIVNSQGNMAMIQRVIEPSGSDGGPAGRSFGICSSMRLAAREVGAESIIRLLEQVQA